MYCKHCGKFIDDDSKFCSSCGKSQSFIGSSCERSQASRENSRKSGTYKAPNGKSYKVKDGIMYDEDGWDVGRVPSHWDGNW